MRRSTRHSTGSGSLFPSPFQSCINATDMYARELNLRPLILHLPFDEEINHVDLHGLSIRLRRNKSFVYTSSNPNPVPYPSDCEPHLQPLDLSNGNARVDALVASLCNSQEGDARPGILVMFVQPPSDAKKNAATQQPKDSTASVSIRSTDEPDIEVFAESRPLTGILVKIGAPRALGESSSGSADSPSGPLLPNGLPASVSDRLERSIVGAFCRRSVPDDATEEILRVTLVRAIVEAICYEDVMAFRESESKHTGVGALAYTAGSFGTGGHVSQNLSLLPLSRNDPMAAERDKRFISINTQDMALCPAAILPSLLSHLRFMKHWDKEDGINEFVHEDSHRECSCIRKVRSLMVQAETRSAASHCNRQESQLNGTSTATESSSSTASSPSQQQHRDERVHKSVSMSIPSDFYQFFTLNTKRIKGLLDQQLHKLVPEVPLPSAYTFCYPIRTFSSPNSTALAVLTFRFVVFRGASDSVFCTGVLQVEWKWITAC